MLPELYIRYSKNTLSYINYRVKWIYCKVYSFVQLKSLPTQSLYDDVVTLRLRLHEHASSSVNFKYNFKRSNLWSRKFNIFHEKNMSVDRNRRYETKFWSTKTLGNCLKARSLVRWFIGAWHLVVIYFVLELTFNCNS